VLLLAAYILAAYLLAAARAALPQLRQSVGRRWWPQQFEPGKAVVCYIFD